MPNHADGNQEQSLVLENECQKLQRTITELTEERDRLRTELARVTEERDAYLKSLYYLTRKDITFTEQDLREMETSGLTLDDVLAEIEKMVGKE
jgi:hypothetical protein